MNDYEPIAIVGYGCLYPPLLTSPEELWDGVLKGTKGVRNVNNSVWDTDKYYSKYRSAEDKTYCKKTGYLSELPHLEKLIEQNGLNSDEVIKLNRTQKMILYTVLKALESANLNLESITQEGFVIGNMLGDESFANYVAQNRMKKFVDEHSKEITNDDNEIKHVKKSLSESLNVESSDFNVFPSNMLAGLKKLLKLHGISFTIDGACSGSLLAIDEAIKLIHQNKTSKSVVTGVLGNIGVTGNVAFSKIGALSDTEARPLDSQANGLIPGEGSGSIIIESLSNAINDGSHIYGVIRGSGVASDGKGQAIYAPSVDGQYTAMMKSLAAAKMTLNDIDYVEMHATGTPVGDKVELQSIMKIFNESGRKKPLKIGSMKHQIGHSFSAAGMANLFKVLQGFNHQNLPPTHGFGDFSAENKSITSNNLIVNSNEEDWHWDSEHGRTASINAFGFGGINANILVQEYDEGLFKSILSKSVSSTLTLPDSNYSIVGQGTWVDKGFQGNIPSEAPISKFTSFPFIKFKMPPKVVQKIDKSQQVGLLAADKALENAKEELNGIPREKIGLYVGGMLGLKTAFECDLRIRSEELRTAVQKSCTNVNSQKLEKINMQFKQKFESLSEDSLPGFMDNIVAGRISNSLDIRGVNAVIDAGKNSFDVAMNQAILSLQNNEYDAVVVGGVNSNDLPEYVDLYNELYSNDLVVENGACFFVIKRTVDLKDTDNEIFNISSDASIKTINNSVSLDADFLGAENAFKMLNKINEHAKRPEMATDFENSEAKSDFSIAFFDTENAIEASQMIKNEMFLDTQNESSKMAIFYTGLQDLEEKVEFLKKIQVGSNE